jgi:hypothetical protein
MAREYLGDDIAEQDERIKLEETTDKFLRALQAEQKKALVKKRANPQTSTPIGLDKQTWQRSE